MTAGLLPQPTLVQGPTPVQPDTAGREPTNGRPRRTIAEVLARARDQLCRLTPAEAEQAWAAGAVLVDIRPAAQREAMGELPGALVVERNVLEWRLDPASDARLPVAAYDLQVIVLCQEGYTSSLAAAALQELGVHHATDVIGGFAAWQALPLSSPASHRSLPASPP